MAAQTKISNGALVAEGTVLTAEWSEESIMLWQQPSWRPCTGHYAVKPHFFIAFMAFMAFMAAALFFITFIAFMAFMAFIAGAFFFITFIAFMAFMAFIAGAS